MAKASGRSKSVEPDGVFVFVLYCHAPTGRVGDVLTHVVHLLRALRVDVQECEFYGGYRNPSVVYEKNSVDVTPSWSFAGPLDDILDTHLNQEMLASFRSVTVEAKVPGASRGKLPAWMCSVDEPRNQDGLAKVVLSIPGNAAPLGGGQSLQEALLHATTEIGMVWPVHFGFAEMQDGAFSDFGASYIFDFIVPIPRRFAIEDCIWRDHPHQSDPRARGMYWMNVWGTELTKRVLQKDDLLEQFSSWTFTNQLGQQVPHTGRVVRSGGGNTVVFLTERVTDCADSYDTRSMTTGRHGWVISLLCWMHTSLRDRGILI